MYLWPSWFVNDVFSSFPQCCPLPVWTRQMAPHPSVSLSGDGSRNEGCECLLGESLLTSLLTQTALIQETTPPVLLCIPKPCICLVIFLYLPAFSLLTSSTGSDHHSLGSPQVILNRSVGSTSLISQPTHGILATFFSL